MLLQPYVENCVKHGIKGVDHGFIKISFQLLGPDVVKCIIQDNGIGSGTVSKSKHISLGTKLLKERMNLLKQQYQLDFKQETEDLFKEDGLACGTKVLFEIPIITS